MTANGEIQGEWYTVDCRGTQLTLPARYQNLTDVEKGIFGIEVRAIDKETNKYVLIKAMTSSFQSSYYAKQTYRELKLFMYFNHSDAQVVQLYNVFTPDKSLNDFERLYFVFNYADYNLHQVIKRGRNFSEDHIKLIIYLLLCGLKFIHSAGIVHHNLMPSNIGITSTSDIMILDFVSAHSATNDYCNTRAPTRWWWAPEQIISNKHNEKLDIWSVGCIMAELILLRPLFRGTDSIDQLHKIFDIIGTPDLAILNDICIPKAVDIISRWPPKPKKDYNELFGYKYDPVIRTPTPTSGVSPDGIDLLDQLLSFDHRTRPTAEEALTHPFFGILHDPTEEPTREYLIDEHQDKDYSLDIWKSLIWKMVEEFVPPPWVNVEDNVATD